MKRISSVTLAVFVLLAVLVANRAVAHRNIARLRDDVTWMAHAHLVENAIADVTPNILDAEAGQRDYLITGNEDVLISHQAAVDRLAANLALLRKETLDDRRAQQQITTLDDLIAARLAALKKGIALRQENDNHASARAELQKGRQQRAAIVKLLDQIRHEQDEVFSHRQASSLSTHQWAAWTNVTTGTISAIILTVSGAWISRNLRTRRKNAEAIQRAHRELQDEMHQRNRMEQALRQSERIYRAIGESLNYGVWLCDAEGRNTYVSPSFLELVGLTQEQCSDFGWGDALHPDDAKRVIAAWKQCVQNGEKWDVEHRFRGIDGAWHPILSRGVPVHDGQGRLICWAGLNIDISRLKRAEQGLQQAHDELERRIEQRTKELTRVNQELQKEVFQHSLAVQRLRERADEKEVLLKEVHHRVKNNLQVISSLLYLQAQKTSDATSRDMFQDSQRRVRSMALVHERLYRAPDLAQVDFADYITHLAESLFASYQSDSDRIRLVVDVSDITLSVDAAVPCGLLANELISNCLKHAFLGRDHGCIRVAMRQLNDAEVSLHISDDGIGLPAEVEPGASSTFGMQVILALVEQLHGSMQVDRGAGTEFRIQFPTAAVGSASVPQ